MWSVAPQVKHWRTRSMICHYKIYCNRSRSQLLIVINLSFGVMILASIGYYFVVFHSQNEIITNSWWVIWKGGEQSERTPPECSVKWPPMNENTWNFACKVLLWGTINFCSNGGHLASVEAKPIFFHFYTTLLSYRLHIWHARVFHEGSWAPWVSKTTEVRGQS